MILVNGRNVNFTNFPDGTSSFRFSLEAGTCNISWKYDNDAECMHLLYLVKHLRAMGIDDLYLNMPYIPNARMDRVKNSDEVFTLKWFSKTISLQRQIFQVICTSPRPTRILSISASTTVSLSSMSILSQSFIYPLMVSMFRFPYISADI